VHDGRDAIAREAINRLARRIARLEQRLANADRSVFQHRCYLCGDPVVKGSRYCHAHQWAETDG